MKLQFKNYSMLFSLNTKAKNKNKMKLLLIAFPFIIYLILFQYVPLYGWIYSIFDYKIGTNFFDVSTAKFVGLEYFVKSVSLNSELLRVLKNTLIFSGLGLLISPLPVILAILLNEVKSNKFRKLIQTTTTLPHFISWIIVFSIAYELLSVNGLVSIVFKQLGLPFPMAGILGDVNLVYGTQVFIGIWKGLGWGAIVYIAAIAGLDAELFDAAAIDGAGRFRMVQHIVIPGIIPTYFVLLLLNISGLLSNGFEQFFMFHNTMVARNIEVLDYYVYKLAIMQGEYSYSIAMGITRSIISIALLFGANMLSKKVRGNTLF